MFARFSLTKGKLNILIRKALLAEIEVKPALVGANLELIRRFEQKIQTTLARI